MPLFVIPLDVTFYVENADLSKEVPVTQYSKLSDPIVCHHSQLPLFNDVHLMPYVTFPTHVLSRVVDLHKRDKKHCTTNDRFTISFFFFFFTMSFKV